VRGPGSGPPAPPTARTRRRQSPPRPTDQAHGAQDRQAHQDVDIQPQPPQVPHRPGEQPHAPDGDGQSIANQGPASQVGTDDRLLVRAGDTIPVDGEVVAGCSSVDQKTITGESVPVVREPGDPVYAGTVNGEGTLEVRASGPVGDAVLSRVVAQVRSNQAGRARSNGGSRGSPPCILRSWWACPCWSCWSRR